MNIVYSIEEARLWFLHNTLGSVQCHSTGKPNKICWTLAEAEEFYGVVASPEGLAETYELGWCCGTCMYWQHTSRNTPASQQVRAECRRFPPVQGTGEIPSWPRTLGKDWCGEYSYCVHSTYAVQPWPAQ